MDLVIRTSSDPASLAVAVRREVHAINKMAPVFNIASLDQRLDEFVAPRRFQSVLMGLLAAVALGLTAAEVLRMIVRQGMTLAGIGLGAGAAGSLLVTHLLSGLLFSVTPTDALTFTLVPTTVAAVALLACCTPAWKAARIDPLAALRDE